MTKKLLSRVNAALKGRVTAAKSFGKNFAHYAKNPNIAVPGSTPEEKDAANRHRDYMRTRQRRPGDLDEGVFSKRKPDGTRISDYPLVHAYATGYNHPVFSAKGDVVQPKRSHLIKTGNQRIALNGQRNISRFEDALIKNGHDIESAHVHGANHSFDFHNNPTKHDQVLPNAAKDLVAKTRGDGMSDVMHGIGTVRALFRKPDKPKM